MAGLTAPSTQIANYPPAIAAALIALDGKIQAGTGTLVAGVLTVATGVTITAASRILVTRKTIGGTMAAAGYDAPSADRVVGAPGVGTFVIRARKDDATAETADTSTVDWLVIG